MTKHEIASRSLQELLDAAEAEQKAAQHRFPTFQPKAEVADEMKAALDRHKKDGNETSLKVALDRYRRALVNGQEAFMRGAPVHFDRKFTAMRSRLYRELGIQILDKSLFVEWTAFIKELNSFLAARTGFDLDEAGRFNARATQLLTEIPEKQRRLLKERSERKARKATEQEARNLTQRGTLVASIGERLFGNNGQLDTVTKPKHVEPARTADSDTEVH